MSTYGDQARRALLDSAEELFATYGVDGVSNRRIAEHAGNANHSAVNYHFGSREELVRAMVTRYAEDTRRRRAELVGLLGPEPGLRDYLSCLVVPFTDQLASMPVPGWRARFLRQLRPVPSMVDIAARTVRHRFLQATGMTQVQIRQFERAQRAAALLQQGQSILDVVYEADYFDQPHLTRSLKHWIGYTPAEIIRMSQPHCRLEQDPALALEQEPGVVAVAR